MKILGFNQNIAGVSDSKQSTNVKKQPLSSAMFDLQNDTVNFTSAIGPGTRADCKAFIDSIKPITQDINPLIRDFKKYLKENNLGLKLTKYDYEFRVNQYYLNGAKVSGYKAELFDLVPPNKYGISDLLLEVEDKLPKVIIGKTAKESALNLILELAKIGEVKIGLWPDNKKTVRLLNDNIVERASSIDKTRRSLYYSWDALLYKDGIDCQPKGDLIVAAIKKLFSNAANPY